MFKKKYHQILLEAIEVFGIEQRNKKTVEELAELIKEIVKERKDEKLRRINIIDEITDSLIMIETQIIINKITKKELKNRAEYKFKRLEKIIKKERENNLEYQPRGLERIIKKDLKAK